MRIGLVNDLPGINELLRRIVSLTPKHRVIWAAGSGAEAVELWVEGEFRIHDRARWTRSLDEPPGSGGAPWSVTRLQP